MNPILQHRRAPSIPYRTPASILLLIFCSSLGGLMHPAPVAAQSYVLQQTHLGENILDQFGFSVAAIGDINADGFADYAIGANVNDQLVLSGGKAYVYLGASDYAMSWAGSFAGGLERGYVGGALAGGGDFNRDGYSDWAVGAPGGGPAGLDPGRVYLFLGGPSLDLVPDLILEGQVALGEFGAALSLRGDLDGDGYADLCVGAPRAGNGRVYIYRGGATADSTADRVLYARPQDQRFGAALAILADDNGDGRDDLLVGAPKSSVAATWAGAVRLYRGSAALDSVPAFALLGENAGDEFGSSVWAGPDLDGDAQPDILVGAPFANAGLLTDAGKGYLFGAGSTLDGVVDRIFSGENLDDHFGQSIAAGFDWDADGADDLAFSAPDHDSGGVDAGRLYVYRGGSALDSVDDFGQNGGGANQHLGTSMAATGDLRHNGRGGLLAGGYNGSNNGRVLLYASDLLPTSTPGRLPGVTARLLPPHPNPFNPRVQLRLSTEAAARWQIAIFDVRGRRIRTLLDEDLAPGEHRLVWDGIDENGSGVASGVYQVRAFGPRQELLRTVTLVR